MISTQIQESAARPEIPFSFTMLVTDDENLPTLDIITSKDEDALFAQYQGTREEFDADLATLTASLSIGTPEYSGPPSTSDPEQSSQENPDAN